MAITSLIVLITLLLVVLEVEISQCHIASVIPGDPRFGFTNKIVRVSRGPNVASDDDFTRLLIQSPAYQLKYRPGSLSRFHSYSGESSFGGGGGSSNFGSSAYSPASNSLSLPGSILGPGAFGFGANRYADWEQDINKAANAEKAASQDGESKYPTYTPMIGARALSNMEQFFEHVKENLHAVQHADNGPESESDPIEDMQDDPFSYPGVESLPDSLNEGISATAGKEINMKARWLPPAGGLVGRHNLHRYSTRKVRSVSA